MSRMRIQKGIKGAVTAFKLRTNRRAPFESLEEFFMLRPQIQLQRPGGRMLVGEMPIGLRHVIWIELRFATDGRDTGRADNAIHDHVRDMHTLRPELARERLHQATQSELRAAKAQP